MSPSRPTVAIVGAGICGLTLALSLHAHDILCTVYELRDTASPEGGAIMLSPNSLRILDRLGVYELIRDEGFITENFLVNYWDGNVDRLLIGSEQAFGYPAIRTHRQVLSGALLKLCAKNGISVLCGKGFDQIIEEHDSHVQCIFKDGSTAEATILIGADGIHSRVRQYVQPSVPPASYTGILAACYELEKSKIQVPPHQQHLFRGPSLIHGRGENGGALTVPQYADGRQQALIVQRPYPPQDRQGWDRLAQDRKELKDLFTGRLEDWPEIVQQMFGLVDIDTPVTIWPHHMLPVLDTWTSEKGRVILLGDAAHAIPPSAGQGANQAIEDGWSFAVALDAASKSPERGVLKLWETMRQERISQIVNFTQKMGNIRLSESERGRMLKDEKIEGHGEAEIEATKWLYAYKFEDELRARL